MKEVFRKDAWILIEIESLWTDVFAESIFGIYNNGTDMPLYEGKSLKDCISWLKEHKVISAKEVTELSEKLMLPDTVVVETITEDEEKILSKSEPDVKDLVEEVIPADDELFSIECKRCHKKYDMLKCKWDGEGNTVCSHCGTSN